VFSFISARILLGQIFPSNTKADIGWGENLNNYLIASCVVNICAKNSQKLLIFSQATSDNVVDVFFMFLYILMHISFGLLFLGSVEADLEWGGKLNIHLIASCIRNIHTKIIRIR